MICAIEHVPLTVYSSRLILMDQRTPNLGVFSLAFWRRRLVVTPNRQGVRERFDVEDLIVLGSQASRLE